MCLGFEKCPCAHWEKSFYYADYANPCEKRALSALPDFAGFPCLWCWDSGNWHHHDRDVLQIGGIPLILFGWLFAGLAVLTFAVKYAFYQRRKQAAALSDKS